MSISLSIQGVSKSYTHYSSGLKRLLSWFGVPVKTTSIEVLNDISINVSQGETVALVGQNGAGKSTLLKIVAQTLMPSTGTVNTQGRVAAILELGMGFNPEFTGRENAYHVLSMMGLDRKQANDLMDGIHRFSEIGSYFDQPVRVYSSGMQMRVAFSVVTSIRPDILIIDEALSVGDSYFQHKSFAKIRDFKEQGSTIFFVSHDKAAILELCDRAVLLQDGTISMDSSAEVVMNYYNALIADKENATLIQTADGDHVKTRSGSLDMEIIAVELHKSSGRPVKELAVADSASVVIDVKANIAYKNAVIGYLIKDRTGRDVFGTNTFFLEQQYDFKAGETKRFKFESTMNLGVGSYSLTAAIHSGPNHLQENIDWQERACVFDVYNREQIEFVGCNWLNPKLEVKNIE